MNKIKYLIIIFLAGIIPMNYSVIEAQQNENIVNGFIESLELVENQINISVIDNFGNRFNLNIVNSTEIGLETQSGERWVGNIKEDPNYVLELLNEAQHSLEPVTLTHNGADIITLVSYESSNIKNNLGYLAASFIFLSILFFGYIFIINNKLQILSKKK
ncbi:MAG: hypothetical protein EGP06_03955 [SAR202 cluster bacterium]|jgi:hypothetical protein|nr:MAG: hypothetical protein EGP09_00785 [SAR202 cluster bacterium]KAA1298570.1 MAG: hypothetical protein EGP06_03955 [SAR202 cluster bacterium]|tara:strand:+ start:2015 stop:2494 length:480 start_codon:yes stop_codon:yes gene_type:complete